MKRGAIFAALLLSCFFLLSGCSSGRALPEQNDWSSSWIEHANQSNLPRILFVGDSITDGYYPRVSESLADQYYAGWYITSKFVDNPDFRQELKTILKRYPFEVILANNGLHGWDYSEAEYRRGLEKLVALLNRHAPQAEVIWCQTTPVWLKDNPEYLGELNQQVIDRNEIAREVMGKAGYRIIDLYAAMLEHPEYYKADGFHFNPEGKAALAEIILEEIRGLP